MGNSTRDWEMIIVGPVSEIMRHSCDWQMEQGFEGGWNNFGEELMLVVTELNEAKAARGRIEMALDDFFSSGTDLEGMATSLESIEDALWNYFEEWADVMVRVFNLCQSCGLSIEIRDPDGELQDISSGLRGMLDGKGAARVEECIHCLSEAMEAFRHVKLLDGPANELDCPEPEESQHLKDVSEWLGGAATVAAWAICDLGENWRSHYVSVMQKNEKRPYKHGKQC